MSNNYWMKREGKRASSEMIMRNAYKQFGIQYYLLVEGESDMKFFGNIIDCTVCKIVDMKGKSEVREFIKEQNKIGKRGYLGIVDADFEHIDSNEEYIDNVLIVDEHDIEMLIMKSSPNMRKIYAEFSDNLVIANFEKEQSETFFDAVVNAAYKIGCLKYVAKMSKYRINMQELPYCDFINEKIEVDIPMIIERIKGRHFESELRNDYETIVEKSYNKWQMGCGHDVTNIFALCFCNKGSGGLGYGRNRYPMKKEKIESALRLAYNYTYFLSTALYKKMEEWQTERNIQMLLTDDLQIA